MTPVNLLAGQLSSRGKVRDALRRQRPHHMHQVRDPLVTLLLDDLCTETQTKDRININSRHAFSGVCSDYLCKPLQTALY